MKSTLLSVASYVLMAAGTFLFGKEHFLPEKSKP